MGASLPGLHLWAMGGLSKSWGSYQGILGTWAPLASLTGMFPSLSSLFFHFVWVYGKESRYRTKGQTPGDGGALSGDPLAFSVPRQALQSHQA